MIEFLFKSVGIMTEENKEALVQHFRQVQDKMKSDKVKSNIKKLLVQIDSEKKGNVNLEAFA